LRSKTILGFKKGTSYNQEPWGYGFSEYFSLDRENVNKKGVVQFVHFTDELILDNLYLDNQCVQETTISSTNFTQLDPYSSS
jgi:hypothetical protein